MSDCNIRDEAEDLGLDLDGNSSVSCVLGLLSYMMQHHMFDPLQSHLVEGIISLELAWVLTPIP